MASKSSFKDSLQELKNLHLPLKIRLLTYIQLLTEYLGGVSPVQMVNADKSLRREISKPQDIRDLFVSRFKHMGMPKVVNDTKVPTKSPGKGF